MSVYGPGTFGANGTENGGACAVPTTVSPARRSTRATAPLSDEDVVTAIGPVMVAPSAGAVMLTVGGVVSGLPGPTGKTTSSRSSNAPVEHGEGAPAYRNAARIACMLPPAGMEYFAESVWEPPARASSVPRYVQMG